jgi:hypothetical protein
MFVHDAIELIASLLQRFGVLNDVFVQLAYFCNEG